MTLILLTFAAPFHSPYIWRVKITRCSRIQEYAIYIDIYARCIDICAIYIDVYVICIDVYAIYIDI